jgi:hypothetical protein
MASTHTATARKPATTGTTIHGRNRTENGAASRLVHFSLVSSRRSRSESNGLDFWTCGSPPSASFTSPAGHSFSATRYRTLSALTGRPMRDPSVVAISDGPRWPSMASRVA